MTATPVDLPLRVDDLDEEETTAEIDPDVYAELDARADAVGMDLALISAECTLTPGLHRRH
jgi:hypothetical protein